MGCWRDEDKNRGEELDKHVVDTHVDGEGLKRGFNV